MPEPGDKSGGPKEVREARDFFARLNPVDVPGVMKVTDVIRQFAADYHKYHEYYSYDGVPGFFGVFGIGGVVTKTGERPDIDLLVVTNAYLLHEHDFIPTGQRRSRVGVGDDHNKDWLVISLMDGLASLSYRMDILDPIPDQYSFDDGLEASTRAVLRLTPVLEGGQNEPDPKRKPIDIVYDQPNLDPRKRVESLYDFEQQDVDRDGNALANVLLYFADNLGSNLSDDDED